MKRLSNAPLRTKIIVTTLFISFIVSVVMTALSAYREYARVSQDFFSRLELEVNIISNNVGSALLFSDREALQETANSFYSDPAILQIMVFDGKGDLYFESNRIAKGRVYDHTRAFTNDVVVDGETIGRVRVLAFNHDIDRITHGIIFSMFLNIGIVMILVLILSSVFQRFILAPIYDIYRVSEHIEKTNDYSMRITHQAKDEIGRLALMLNRMLDKIEARDDRLEKLVEQRAFESEKLADELRHRTFHDALTGLPNSALLSERFLLAVEHAERNKNRFALLVVDIDNFKSINEKFSFVYGDQLLLEVARRLKELVRKEDLVARLGGDEFVVLINDLTQLDDLQFILSKLVRLLVKEIFIDNEPVEFSVSIGAAVFPNHGSNLAAIRRKADVAMCRVKDEGKNGFAIYSDVLSDDVKHRLMVENELAKAIEEDQLVIHLQPRIYLPQQKVVGCEVLIRWNHPREGLLSPKNFIPHASESKKIIEIDYCVITKTCELLARWESQNKNRDFFLAVRLSAWHFANFNIVGFLKKSLDRYKVKPELIEIAVSESMLRTDPGMAQKVLMGIKALGVRINLDDFGAGYSSLNYLRTLPIDSIKLDQYFIQEVETTDKDRKLIKAIMTMGSSLNLPIIVSGVETEVQLQALEKMTCDYVQGYYFMKPGTEKEFDEWLQVINVSYKKRPRLDLV